MTQSTTVQVGRFYTGRLAEGRPQALNTWRFTTDDAEVAARVAALLGGQPQPNEGGGALAHEVLTNRERVRVLMDGPDAVAAHMILWGSKGIIHECDGLEFLSPEEKKGQPCGCPPRLEGRKMAARDGRGPTPSINLTFRIAAEPALGDFRFMTGSWQLAAQLPDLTDALERVGGPAVCDLTMELVVFTTKAGRSVCYRRPVVTVLGSPDTVAPESPPPVSPPPPPTPSAPRRRTRKSAEHSVPPAPERTGSVNVDADLLRRAGQALGTSDPQETVIAALSEVVASQQRATELAQLREHVERIAAIAEQALQGADRSLA
ncbi:recombination directionality factor [Streptomyces noursei]